MVFGHKNNGSENRLGNKYVGSSSIGTKRTLKKGNDQQFHKEHSVEATQTVSHDQGPGFAFNHKYKDNTHAVVHNDLERYRAPPKQDKNESKNTFI